MLLNIALGFVLPWIFGVYLYRKNPLIVLAIAPFSAVVSFLINAVGFALEWWNLTPYMRIETLAALPLNIGLYPVLGSWCIILIQRLGHSLSLMLIFALGTTLLRRIRRSYRSCLLCARMEPSVDVHFVFGRVCSRLQVLATLAACSCRR